MRATLLLPILSLTLGALANPPACLLSAVGAQDSPADLGAVCGDNAKDVQETIDADCKDKDSKSLAQEAFISTCSAAGSSVAAYTPSSTSSGSSSSATGTRSGSSDDPSNTASAFESGASATGSGAAASATGGSGSGAADVRVMGGFVAGAVAVAGLAIGL